MLLIVDALFSLCLCFYCFGLSAGFFRGFSVFYGSRGVGLLLAVVSFILVRQSLCMYSLLILGWAVGVGWVGMSSGRIDISVLMDFAASA